jgi:hypothetical protein
VNDAPSDGSVYGRKDAAWAKAVQLAGDTLTGLLQFSGTGHAGMKLNNLTTAQRNALTPAAGMAIYNSTLATPQMYSAAWETLALLERAQTFTAAQKINTNSATALLVEQDGVKDNVLVVDTTTGRVGIGGAPVSRNLEIFAAANANAIVRLDAHTNGGFNASVELRRPSTSFGAAVALQTATTGKFVFGMDAFSTDFNITDQVGSLIRLAVAENNGDFTLQRSTATTGAILNIARLNAFCSTTPAAGFGPGLSLLGQSSTTVNQAMGRIAALWNVATHASRVADLVAYASYSGGDSEIWRGRAGAAPLVGFLGATPVARAAHIADPSGGGTQDAEARTAINAILVVLENLGFVATS